MKTADTILIADRNPHIRNFLWRELSGSGYRVRSVHDANDLLQIVFRDNTIGILVLDPDFPCLDGPELARKLSERVPGIPVVLHCVSGSEALTMFGNDHVVRIEKNGCSVETLKEAIHRILSHRDPDPTLYDE
jgi:DNA-binding NtrC family response regulator